MTKFGILSDIHAEFDTFGPWDFEPQEDVFYLCAGDIDSNPDRFFDFVERHNDHMFWVRGNHDFYQWPVPRWVERNNTKAFEIQYQPVKIREHNGLLIAGATLWTDLTDEQDWIKYTDGLADYNYIRMTKEQYNEIHYQHLKQLMRSKADIFVTHHCPTLKSIAPEYANSNLNRCFANDLEWTILNMKKPPKLWVCGHTHWEHDYWVGDTHVVCHPRGYPGENPWYEDYAPLEIEI